MPSVLSSTPSRVEKRNFCSKLTKNKKSSILAKPSPRHARLPRGGRKKRLVAYNVSCASVPKWMGSVARQPAENGRNASLLTNFPSVSRKRSGLNTFGVSHSFSSKSTEVRFGITAVPWMREHGWTSHILHCILSLINKTTWNYYYLFIDKLPVSLELLSLTFGMK